MHTETNPAIQPRGNPAHSDSENLLDFARILDIAYRRRWLVVCTFLLVLAIGAMYTLTRRPIYQSGVSMVVAAASYGSYGNGSDLNLFSDLQALTKGRSIETQMGILKSSEVQKAARDKLNPVERGLAIGIDVDSQRDSDLMSVTASAYDPKVAAKLAGAVADAYMERDLRTSTQAIRQARKYVERELTSVELSLRTANKSLSQYKERTGLFTVDAQVGQATQQMAEVQMDINKTAADLNRAQGQVIFYGGKLRSQGQEVVASAVFQRNPLFQDQLGAIRGLQDKRAQLTQEFKSDSREIRGIEGEIADAEQRLRSIAQTIAGSKTKVRNPMADRYVDAMASVEAARSYKQSLESTLIEQRKLLSSLPEQERGLAELLQEVDIRKRTYEMLSDRYYTLQVNEQSVLPNAMILSAPIVSKSPSYPSRRRNVMMFALIGLLVAAGVAYAAETIDTKIRDEGTVATVTGSVALTGVPNVDVDPSVRVMIGELQHNSAFLEAFRILRNNISFTTIDRPLKLLAVTSPGRSEGKSTTAVNLAIAVAMDGKRVLIVDADLRRPSIHRWMKISRDIGFTSVVKGQTDVSSAVVASEIENVFVLPSGPLPPNPTEFLNSQASRNLLRQLAEEYDMVILDCPPCAGLSDMQVISTAVDAVLLVVSMNRTLRPNLYITMQTLKQVDAPLIGFVLNRLDIRRRGYGYYYSYYYYYYDYDEDDAKDKGGKKTGRRTRHK